LIRYTRIPTQWFHFPLVIGLVIGGNLQAAQLKPIQLHIQVPVNKSTIHTLEKPVRNIIKIDSNKPPNIAEITLVNGHHIWVHGNLVGFTNTLLVDDDKQVIYIIDVEVTPDIETLKRRIHELLPGEKIGVRSAKRNIVLSGEISNLVKMEAVVRLAEGFLIATKQPVNAETLPTQPHVVNLMTVGGAQQVMLKVIVAEIKRSLGRELGVTFHATTTGSDGQFGISKGGTSFDEATQLFRPIVSGISSSGIFGLFSAGSWLFDLTIEASQDNGLIKLLAEPNLTTLSGEKASFLSGGEFPFLSDCGQNQCSVSFKEFGVGVDFLPTVLDSGQINLQTAVIVSELSDEASLSLVAPNGVVLSQPSLTERKISSTVELADGQTLSIAGLIRDNVTEAATRFPGLGDIPYLGMLFRSQQSAKEQTELVIFVTPHLARPIHRKDIQLPTDSFIEPNDIEFYLLGRMEAQYQSPGSPGYQNSNSNHAIGFDGGMGFEGNFGHQLSNGRSR